MIKDILPAKTGNHYTSWNIDLLYCNLNGSHPSLSNDPNQDLIQRHGEQLLQLRDQKKMRKGRAIDSTCCISSIWIALDMDRCTKLEEICTNWNLKPKLFIAVCWSMWRSLIVHSLRVILGWTVNSDETSFTFAEYCRCSDSFLPFSSTFLSKRCFPTCQQYSFIGK